jgi:hypothetical protein
MNKRDYDKKILKPFIAAVKEAGFEQEYEWIAPRFKKELPIGRVHVGIDAEAPRKGSTLMVYTNIWWPNDEVANLLRKKFSLGYSGKNNYHFEAEQFDHFFPIIMSYIDELHKVEL